MKNIIKKRALSLSDTLIAIFVVPPFVVGFWRGTWGLMDQNTRIFPGVQSFFLGCIIHLCFALLRDILKEKVVPQTNQTLCGAFKSHILRRVYIYVFAIGCVMHWRGTWAILDEIFVNRPLFIVATGGIATVVLMFLRASRNVMAPPVMICIDFEDVVFSFPTRFDVKSSDKTSLYILDCLFSVFVIGSLVVFVWRGAWVLLDIFLFPDDYIWSSWVSLILGYAIVAMAFSMQPAMRWLCDRLTGLCRIFVADVFLFFSVIGTINVWRGIWNLLEIYFLPDHPEISCWTTHWVSLVLLILLNCANSLLVRGVYIDAEEPAGKCVVFPIYYLRLIFKNERRKKQIRNIQLDIMVKRRQELDSLKIKNEICTCNNTNQNHVRLLKENFETNHIEV